MLLYPYHFRLCVQEVKEEYDTLRTEFYAGLQDIVYLDMPTSRSRAFKVCWSCLKKQNKKRLYLL
jgi:hypothetical protein